MAPKQGPGLHSLQKQWEWDRPPQDSDRVYYAAPDASWEGSKFIAILPAIAKRKPGERWKEEHSRAERDQHFRLVAIL